MMKRNEDPGIWVASSLIVAVRLTLFLCFCLKTVMGSLQLNWFQLVCNSFSFPGTPSDMFNILRAQSIANSLGYHS
ncbi:hypothetical protein RHGRI_036801 [Rhododendron griersonianum]|uniref:Uncharacterized protein n=1 Tax=Rhododendron griersonianum TaxID=479676 RepID=A0AAV6HUR3_9ERIC|nr:hypothetical protein RHGRI_036801 [Rhododendron griersonianum]